jgi:ActR/RegA family two-component response regulator
MPIKRIVLVGHCGADTSTLYRIVGEVAPKIPVTASHDIGSLANAGPDSLLLINRMLEGAFAEDTGVELIKTLASRAAPPKLMLVSNYADAQAAAVKNGAMPGFGKNAMYDASTKAMIKAAIED